VQKELGLRLMGASVACGEQIFPQTSEPKKLPASEKWEIGISLPVGVLSVAHQ